MAKEFELIIFTAGEQDVSEIQTVYYLKNGPGLGPIMKAMKTKPPLGW